MVAGGISRYVVVQIRSSQPTGGLRSAASLERHTVHVYRRQPAGPERTDRVKACARTQLLEWKSHAVSW